MRTIIALLCLFAATVHAHDLIPGKPQNQAILLQNATVHSIVNGVLERTDVLFENGMITAVGQNLSAPVGTREFDLNGDHVYPTLVALDSQLGLTEIESIRATRDFQEVGDFNPQLQASIAFNPDSELTPTVRHNGVGYIQLVPKGDLLAGRSALMNLDGWNLDDSIVKQDTGVHLYWPEPADATLTGDEYEQALKSYQKRLSQLERGFESAYRYYVAYQANKEIDQDIRWHAMMPLFEKANTLYVHADEHRQIKQALALSKRYGFKSVLVGGYDAYDFAEELLKSNTPVVYLHTNGLPRRPHESYDHAFVQPTLLHQAGVKLALTWSGSWDSRNLAFAAGHAIAFGLPKSAALEAITLTPARLLGVDDLGAIAKGYRASLIITKGDLLDMSSPHPYVMYLDGRKVDLDNRQNRLYQKYRKRLAGK